MEIGKDSKFTLSIETAISIADTIFMVVGLWFNLQADIEEAKQLLPLLPRRTRYSPAAMIAFYDKILRQIEKQQGDVFTKRVILNKIQKMSLAAAVYVRHRMLPRFLDPVWSGLSKIGLLPSV